MNQLGKDLSRRFFYTKFLVGNPSSDREKILEIEEYVQNNHQCILPKSITKVFISDWKTRWNKCRKNRQYLEARFGSWLDQPLFERDTIAIDNPSAESHATGRRPADFQILSASQKRRRTTELRKEASGPLAFAASSSLRMDGNDKAAKLIEEATASPQRAGKILTAYNNRRRDKSPGKMTDDQALALAMDCGLTTHQYLLLRQNSKKIGADSYPNYHKIREAKARCYPEGISITECEAIVNSQCLVNHTASRLVQSLSINELPEKVIAYYKWGFDGSSGHAEFKQIFESNSADSSVVITTLVPVRMISAIDGSIVWDNPTASSTRYCQPIRICYEKESTESIKREYDRVKIEIRSLTPTTITVDAVSIVIHHELFITMIDGKTINAIQGNKASSRCYICKCGPSEMNNLRNKNSRLEVGDRNDLQYGISPLHARIRFFEYLLQISYRLNLQENSRKKGTRKTTEDKKLLADRKKEIQSKFRKELGLIVDMPKPGFGSSNDGNTARKFFENTKISSEITGIDQSIIHRFSIILIAINSSEVLDPEKFAEYTNETAKILVDQYGWWSMSPTVHKVLLHGADIMSHAILPLGQLSEEASEHRNKDFKNYRSQFARKNSRIANLTDIFHRFLCTSDPLITHMRASTKKKNSKRELPIEVQRLLKLSEIVGNEIEEESAEEEGEEHEDEELM